MKRKEIKEQGKEGKGMMSTYTSWKSAALLFGVNTSMRQTI